MNSSRLLPIPLLLILSLLPSAAVADISISGNQVTVDTSAYTAHFTGALMTSFINKLAGEAEMIDAPSPAEVSVPLIRLATLEDDVWVVPTGVASVAMDGDDAVVAYQSASPEATYRLRIAIDPGTEDLVLHAEVDCPGPLHLRFWDLYPEHTAGRLLLPFAGGTLLPSTMPPDMPTLWGTTDWLIDFPGLLYERNDHAGGLAFWVAAGDTRIRLSYLIDDSTGKRMVRTLQTAWNQPVTADLGLEYRLNAYAGNWSHGVDLIKRRVGAPIDNHPPAWLQDIKLVYNITHMHDPDTILTADDITALTARANDTFPEAAPLAPRHLLLYHNDWSSDGHDRNYPDYATNLIPGWYGDETPYQVFMAGATAAGYPTMPYFNSACVNRYLSDQEDPSIILGDHWAWVAYQDNIIEEWDYGGQRTFQRGWNMDPLSAYTCYAVGLTAAEGFRNYLRDRILTVTSAVHAPAAFLDVSGMAWGAADINPNNSPGTGASWTGLQTLIGELRAAGLLVSGEMSCWETVKAGQQMYQTWPTGFSEFPAADYRRMSAVTGLLLRDSEVPFGHLAMPSPDVEPDDYFRQYLAGFMQGSLPTARWPSTSYWQPYENQYGGRGKQWVSERALYDLNHHVRFETGVSDLWSDDRTLVIEDVDGIDVARTEDWLVKMLICDWYWIYGGRAPSADEFAAATTDTHLSDGSLIAQLDAIVAKFQVDPTPPENVEPRGLALARIYMLFPEYPLVHHKVRWINAAGGTVTGTVRRTADFADVDLTHWAFFPIEACYDAGIVQGYWNGYRPADPVTRAQMAVYIARALADGDANVPTGPAEVSFTDVPDDYWAFHYIDYCTTRGIVQGYPGGAYRPEEMVNRGQMAVYIARAIADPVGDAGVPEVPPGTPNTFPDVTADNEWSWCYKHVQYLAGQGIVQGYPSGAYRPDLTVTRDQMAVYVARAFQLPL